MKILIENDSDQTAVDIEPNGTGEKDHLYVNVETLDGNYEGRLYLTGEESPLDFVIHWLQKTSSLSQDMVKELVEEFPELDSELLETVWRHNP